MPLELRILSDEERRNIWVCGEGTLKAISQAEQANTVRQIVEWGDSICAEHLHFCERWHCPECRQELKALAEVKK